MSTQTTDVTAWLDGLEEARKAATPGPWKVAYPFRKLIDLPERLSGAAADRPDDAALIVAAVNALPELTAALRGVLALAEELDDIAAMNDESAVASRPGSAHGARHTGLRDSARDAADRIRAAVAAAHNEQA